MLRHARRATPWAFLGSAAVLVTALLRVVEEWPYTMWPLQGIAVGLLAAAAAWLFDEPSAAVVDTLPCSLAWRTAARGLIAIGLLGWWLGAVAWTRTAYFGHATDVAWQGLVAVVATVAYVTWRRRRGAATPARSAGTAAVGGTVYLALARPFEDLLVVFPYTAAGPWAESRTWWTVLGVAAVAALVVELTEVDRRPAARLR